MWRGKTLCQGGAIKTAELSAKEFVAFIGVSTDTIRRAVRTGETPAIRVRTALRVDRDEVYRCMQRKAEAMYGTRFNDATGHPLIKGTCGTGQDTFNVGNHSMVAPLNIGSANVTNPLGAEYLPVIMLRNKANGTEFSTADPDYDYGEMGRYWKVQRLDSPGGGGTGPLFPQRLSRNPEGRRGVRQCSL